MTEFIANEFGGHNVFNEVDVNSKISFTLLSMVYKEDCNCMHFAIANNNNSFRPVISLSYTPKHIDLLSSKLEDTDLINLFEDVNVTYYNGIFTFKTKDNKISTSIEKDILVKNYGFGIID